ncbi:uncharacterized protein UV8b_07189 [Ustilaginoidea virens]|uniref:Uncharacterized protein n=1 Tax=Ustilaginoidea virens TaxID=1159556 RepID=A0A8E5HWQ2_USTVR|nr:uncharacterized protein UV8b_07189 [Ustilaginoidea virens]QUC22948.1 hypothetical protein UV8b_07189 [Ustilaginoidea virens]
MLLVYPLRCYLALPISLPTHYRAPKTSIPAAAADRPASRSFVTLPTSPACEAVAGKKRQRTQQLRQRQRKWIHRSGNGNSNGNSNGTVSWKQTRLPSQLAAAAPPPLRHRIYTKRPSRHFPPLHLQRPQLPPAQLQPHATADLPRDAPPAEQGRAPGPLPCSSCTQAPARGHAPWTDNAEQASRGVQLPRIYRTRGCLARGSISLALDTSHPNACRGRRVLHTRRCLDPIIKST